MLKLWSDLLPHMIIWASAKDTKSEILKQIHLTQNSKHVSEHSHYWFKKIRVNMEEKFENKMHLAFKKFQKICQGANFSSWDTSFWGSGNMWQMLCCSNSWSWEAIMDGFKIRNRCAETVGWAERKTILA